MPLHVRPSSSCRHKNKFAANFSAKRPKVSLVKARIVGHEKEFNSGGTSFWNKWLRMGYCRQNIGLGNRLPLHILDLMMWLVGVWKDLV